VRKRPSSAEETHDALVELRALYAGVDALHRLRSCPSSTDCCRFGVTGREPYPTAIELAELERAVRARGGLPKRRNLPVASERRCTFLGDDGKCLVYEARPFGCRTFFCERAEGPPVSRDEIARVSRAIQDLSQRFAPRDPGPRPISRATAEWRIIGRRA
jgi:uncharacterized protein